MTYLKQLLISFFFIIFSTAILAQPSLVPSYHPVYEWLHLQRVAGNLPDYDYESLPLTRGQILLHLKELESNTTYQVGTSSRTLQSFINEFDYEHLKNETTHSLITNKTELSFDRFKNWIWSDEEMHIYSYIDSTGFLVLDHGFGRRAMFVEDGNISKSAPYIISQNWRSYGSYKNLIGYHTEFIRAVPVGDADIFQYDGFYSYNWKSLSPSQNVNNNYHYEGYVTVHYSIFEGTIGRGNLKEGVGLTENLAFSRSGYPLDWIRFKVGNHKIRYEQIIGKPTWRSYKKPFPADNSITTKNSPERWLAYHKISINPFNWLKFSVYEMINYSNRGAEISYINPVNRYAFAEWELQDQDNGWLGASIVINPIKGTELYSEFLVDDLGNKKDIFMKKEFPATSRFGRKYGLSIAPTSSIQFWSEYNRIDPFLYSHPYQLNAHTDKGVGLGSQIGPNADRLEAGLKLWGVGRSFVTVSYSYNRQGLNEYDNNGNITFLSGASVNDSRSAPYPTTYLFLDGDMHTWHRMLGELEWEFKRNYVVKFHYERRQMIEGEQLSNRDIFWADFIIGF